MTTDAKIEPAVVAALYSAHAVELRAFVTGVLRNGEQAQEIVQATFGKLIELGHTAQEESLKGWLFQVAYREALVLRRRQGVQKRALPKLADIARREPDPPDMRLERQDVADQVRQALGCLAPEQRIVVEKRIYEEKTFAQIAVELQTPLGTVLFRMRKAVQVLKHHLQSDD